ncbi:MAG: biotin--[acetyl-CoA-carboxylase] ligase [Micavibrio sp.]|nr:biotin--[acetyl-CoA-carboxylase] ligase [Micavibrio sp.]
MNWDIEIVSSTSSTQDHLKSLADIAEGKGIQALRQENGRGRHGRSWFSAEGNLALSFMLTPMGRVEDIGVLSLMCGLACYRTAAKYVDNALLMLKWPNDLLLDGRKCAGILIESELLRGGVIDRLYVGIGVNLNSSPIDIASNFASYADGKIDPNDFRDAFLNEVAALYALYKSGEAQLVLDQWKEAAHKVGDEMSVKLGGQIISGRYRDIDAFGNLSLCLGEEGFKTITSGDVFLGVENADVTGD